jgi:hypothetical protein
VKSGFYGASLVNISFWKENTTPLQIALTNSQKQVAQKYFVIVAIIYYSTNNFRVLLVFIVHSPTNKESSKKEAKAMSVTKTL